MPDTVQIDIINSADDFAGVYDCIAKCFGEQVKDGVWMAMNPGWNTAEGREAGIQRLIRRWQSVTTNNKGDPNTVFLKATVPDADNPGRRVIAGVAIWVQLSFVEGYGDEPSTDLGKSIDLDELYPGNEVEQRFLRQCYASLVGPRVESVKEKETASPPATFVLDLCVVDPSFQRRGIAVKLVKWGLEEAARRGGLESTTEASAMGRFVYSKLGYKPVKDVVYEVDEEFKQRSFPPNLFMRTGPVHNT